MTDYHARQFDGGPTACDSRNCAAASAAMAIHYGSGILTLTSDDVRTESKVSCVPGEHSASGGLFISDVVRVADRHGVFLDYGVREAGGYTRWNASMAREKLSRGFGGIFLGDYDQVPAPYRADTAFQGDHSTFAHDYRTDLAPYRGSAAEETVHWHDPLRSSGIRLPLRVLLAYWQKPGSPVRGYAGFVEDGHLLKPPDTSTGEPMQRFHLEGTPIGAYTVRVDTALIAMDESRVPVKAGREGNVFAKATLPDGRPAFLVGYSDTTGLLVADERCTFEPSHLLDAAYNEGRDAVVNAAASVPRR